jgi:hypothetical protein
MFILFVLRKHCVLSYHQSENLLYTQLHYGNGGIPGNVSRAFKCQGNGRSRVCGISQALTAWEPSQPADISREAFFPGYIRPTAKRKRITLKLALESS